MPEVEGHISGMPPLAPPSGRMSAEELVFGVGFKRDVLGKPIEQGHGALGHETSQHLAALERTKKLLSASGEGDLAEVKKLLQELIQPPEDMTPEQKAAAVANEAASKAQEDAQEKRIDSLEQTLKAQSEQIDKLLKMLGQPATPPVDPAKAADQTEF